GPLLPRAHDMGREARIQRALAGTVVPVAQILFEDAGELIGVPFYVMEKVDGYVIRGDLPGGWADSAADRCAVGDVLIDTLADLHGIDPDAVGLTGYARPGRRVLAEPAAEFVHRGDVPALGPLPLVAPPAYLPLPQARGPAVAGQPDR